MDSKLIIPLIALLLAIGGCKTTDDNSTSITLTSLVPATRAYHLPAFTLTINGDGFTTDTKVECNSRQLVTTFVSSTQLTCQVTPIDIPDQAGGIALIRVSQSNAISAPLALTVMADPIFSQPIDLGGGQGRNLDWESNRNWDRFDIGIYSVGEQHISIVTSYYDYNGTNDFSLGVSLRRSKDGGATFAKPKTFRQVDDVAVSKVLAGPRGGFYVLEIVRNPFSYRLATLQPGASIWDIKPMAFHSGGLDSHHTRLFVAPAGDEYILASGIKPDHNYTQPLWLHSSDQGRTWSDPQFQPLDNSFGEAMLFDLTGGMTLVWSNAVSLGGSMGRYRLSYWLAHSTTGGQSWESSLSIPLSIGYYYFDFSSVIADNFRIFRDDSAALRLFFFGWTVVSRDSVCLASDDQGVSWQPLPPIPISFQDQKSAKFQGLEQDSRFNLNLICIHDNHLYFTRSCDFGFNWNPLQSISLPPAYQLLSAAMTVDTGGTIHITMRTVDQALANNQQREEHIFYCSSR